MQKTTPKPSDKISIVVPLDLSGESEKSRGKIKKNLHIEKAMFLYLL